MDAAAPTTERLLNDRYELVEHIGTGGFAVTYRARDTESGESVAIKELAIERVEDWKSVELFEREADVLRRLDHPGIPDYLDAFSVEESETVRHYLVQEYVDGEDLRDLLHDGETYDEPQIREFLAELLDVLAYLHERKPPVVHRDVKPSNIIRTEKGDWALVDFGVVQQVWADTVGGSTFVGTSGYMPPEQAAGRAGPPSDLYALGAATIELMSGRPPGDFPTTDMKIRFRGRIDVSPPLADFLECMLEPVPEDRFADAAEARSELRSLSLPQESPETRPAPETSEEPDVPGQPLVEGSALRREVTPSGDLKLSVPVDTLVKAQDGTSKMYRFYLPTGFLFGSLTGTVVCVVFAFYGGATLLGLVFFVLATQLVPPAFDREIQLEIDPESFRVTRLRRWPGSSKQMTKSLQGKTSALKQALQKKCEYGDWTPSVDDYLPASDALDWLIVERMDTAEAEALYEAIARLDRT